MKKFVLPLVLLASLAACASTEAKRHVGKSISEAFISYGRPEAIFNLPDGRRAFQFYWGGGSGVIAGRSNTTVRGGPYDFNVTTAYVPATKFKSNGCLVTLIARPKGRDFVVEEYRIPKRVTC